MIRNTAFQAKAAERQAQAPPESRILLLVAVVLVVLGGSIKLALDLAAAAPNTCSMSGVSVDGLKLNGYSKEEAAAKLQALNADRISSMTVHLSYSDRGEWTISPEQIGVALNIDEVRTRRGTWAQEGNIFARQPRRSAA